MQETVRWQRAQVLPIGLHRLFTRTVAQSHLLAPARSSVVTICPKAPYAGCMTAPCQITRAGFAQCSCPVFWGPFQVPQSYAQCTLGNDLVWSASYDPSGAPPP